MSKSIAKKLAAAVAFIMISATPALCTETFEGTIQGANHVVYQLQSPKNINDPLIALERDFVLVTEDGKYYFMPNLSRMYKESAFKQQVRVTGEQNGAAILVENFDVLKNEQFRSLWNRTKEIREQRK